MKREHSGKEERAQRKGRESTVESRREYREKEERAQRKEREGTAEKAGGHSRKAKCNLRFVEATFHKASQT